MLEVWDIPPGKKGRHGGEDPLPPSVVIGPHVVSSPQIDNSFLMGTAAADLWVASEIAGSSLSAEVTLAEYFDGTGWSGVHTLSVKGRAAFGARRLG
jgi:hypothetical protein